MRFCLVFPLAVALNAAAPPEVEIRVVYDNTSARPGVQQDWGYAAVVTFGGKRLLFDSGTKPDLFLENLKKLGVDADTLGSAMISHQHPDHRNGIYKLFPLAPRLPVHFLDSFEAGAWTAADQVGLQPVRITGPKELLPGMFTTGTVEGTPNEQALLIETSKGLVIMVGCSHPGVVRMVDAALRLRAKPVRLLMGGFHMFQQAEPSIRQQINELKRRNIQSVRPAHCTGDLAHRLFREAWGEAYGAAGAGNVIPLD